MASKKTNKHTMMGQECIKKHTQESFGPDSFKKKKKSSAQI